MFNSARLTRRRFLGTTAAAVAGLSLAGRNPWAFGESRGPVALALTIGVNHINPDAYEGQSGPLKGPEGDADAMAAIARSSGKFADVRTLSTRADRNGPPHGDEVLNHIGWAARILKKGDLFLLTYSGHGRKTYDDPSGDETGDHKDDTWCLEDGDLVDDILDGMWSKFRNDVRIVVFSDSCFSGTMDKDIEMLARAEKGLLSLPKNLRDDPREKDRVFKELETKAAPAHKALAEKSLTRLQDAQIRHEVAQEPLFKGLPEPVTAAGIDRQRKHIENIRQQFPIGGKTKDLGTAPVKGLLFAACDEFTKAIDGRPNSVFTEGIMDAIGTANFGQSYSQLYQSVSHLRPNPVWKPFGRIDESFHREPLFSIG